MLLIMVTRTLAHAHAQHYALGKHKGMSFLNVAGAGNGDVMT